MKNLLRICAALLSLAAVQAAPAPTLEAVTQYGAVRGAPSGDGIVAFKSIPYAAPPIGPLRWRTPRPPSRWSTPRDATRFGSPCFASPLPGLTTAPQSEDCLTINVWTPRADRSAKRPVMVWIHGGGFEFGSSAQRGYDGTKLAQHGVVLVTFNYRIGVLGFLAHPALDREGPASGNYGLQDQIAALRWVRGNIAAFGGDPANVTIFGESAGAHAVGILMASPQTKGLFAKAIAQSGAFWDAEHGSLETHSEALARGMTFQKKMNAVSLANLRTMPADALNAAASWDFRLDPGITAFSPSVDGFVLRDSPAGVFARGGAAKVPLLAGWNAKEEAPLFLPRSLSHGSPQAFRTAAAELFGIDRMKEFEKQYPSSDPTSSSAALIGDQIISEQTWELLGLQQKARRGGVYAYEFSFMSPYSPVANHGAEVKYVFGNLLPSIAPGAGEVGPRDRDTADLMMRYWTNFATRGDPNGSGLPVWPAYGGPGSKVLAITPTGSAAAVETGTDRFKFIQSFRKRGRFLERWRNSKP